MSTGEIDYSSIFFEGDEHRHRFCLIYLQFLKKFRFKIFSDVFRNTALFLLFCFILLIVFLLSNLFTGVAVGDIEGIQRETKIKKIEIEVSFNYQ